MLTRIFHPRICKKRRLIVGMGLILLLIALGPGCTRRFYRRAADREVGTLLAEKDQVPFWKIANYHVYPDPRARFADPTNPDRPPMPPDDPYAKDYAPNPQRVPRAGIRAVGGTGYLDMLAQWDALNRGGAIIGGPIVQAGYVPDKDNGPGQPESFQYSDGCQFPVRPFLISLDQAVELGLVNSREFQTQRENLYLFALPVTLERFAFTAQFFALGSAIRERIGSDAPGGPANRWRMGSNTGFTKLFSTGALLLVDFANDTIINLTGNRPHTLSSSTINLDIIQPLLRDGGRAVTLEPLTQVERNLLYEIRTYARFRKEFYASIAGNPTGGYLQVLRLAAVLENERKNVQFLKKLLEDFRHNEEGGFISTLQVGDVELQYLQGQTQVLGAEQELRRAFDLFKIQLGLEPRVPIELERDEIEPLTNQFEGYEKVQADRKLAVDQARGFTDVYEALKNPKSTDAELRKIAMRFRPHLRNLFVNSLLVRGTEFRTQFPKKWATWNRNVVSDKDLLKKLNDLREEKRRLEEARDDPKGKRLSLGEQKRLLQVEAELVLGGFEKALRHFESSPWLEKDVTNRLAKHNDAFSDVVAGFAIVLVEAREQRLAGVRKAWPQLPPIVVDDIDLLETDIEKSQEIVTEVALGSRLDLMNEQAFVVDAWRQLAVTANSLLGVFDVQYHMDSRTPPGEAKPLAFNGRRTTHQLILNGELPLVRKDERNRYRAAQIGYQQQRRAYMQAQDFVSANVRNQIRQLRLLSENFKIEQRSVERAYINVESGIESFYGPRLPGVRTDTTALTRQLLDNQRQLLDRQNSLIAIWISYLNTRIQLYRDLEQMPLNQQGVWIDEYVPRQHTAKILPPT